MGQELGRAREAGLPPGEDGLAELQRVPVDDDRGQQVEAGDPVVLAFAGSVPQLTVQDLSARGVGLRVLAGQGAQIDTTTAAGRLVFGIFAALAEFERELIRERTVAGLEAARARGRKGGRKFALSKAQVRLAQAAMAHRDTSVSELCRELGIRPVTLYRYVGPQGQLREQGQKVLAS